MSPSIRHDVKRVTRFYCDVLGFRVSDWMGDFFSFLRCGLDHHTINLMDTGSNRHFHTAFELRDWGHMQTACDFLSLNGYKLLWGPGRHGIGHNLFTYHRAPNGLITELFAELDRMKTRSSAISSRGPGTATIRSGRRPGRRTRMPRTLGHHAAGRNGKMN